MSSTSVPGFIDQKYHFYDFIVQKYHFDDGGGDICNDERSLRRVFQVIWMW